MNQPHNTDILIASHMHLLSGGGEIALLEKIKQLQKRGYSLHVIVGADDQFSEQLRTLDIPFSVIGMPWWVRAPQDRTPYAYRSGDPHSNTVSQIISVIKQLQPKLCLTNTLVMPWLGYACALTNTRHIWYIHEIGTKGLGLQYDIGEDQTMRTISSLSDGIFFNSKVTMQAYEDVFPGDKLLGVMYPTASLKKPMTIKCPFSADVLRLISVGHIKPQKGQFTAVRAMKHLKVAGHKAELLIIGRIEDEQYYDEIHSFIEKNSLVNTVRFLGAKKDPTSYVIHADISLMCATNEAFGLVTVEAMQLGKPVIGLSSGGTSEIIIDGKTGFLFPDDDPKILAEKIALLDTDRNLLTAMGKEAAQYSEKHFNNNSVSPLVEYFDTLESQPHSILNLTPLSSVLEDYSDLLLQSPQKPSLLTRVGRPIKRKLKKLMNKA